MEEIRNPANQLRLVVYPHYIFTGFLYISAGTGFLNHQLYEKYVSSPQKFRQVSHCQDFSRVFLKVWGL